MIATTGTAGIEGQRGLGAGHHTRSPRLSARVPQPGPGAAPPWGCALAAPPDQTAPRRSSCPHLLTP